MSIVPAARLLPHAFAALALFGATRLSGQEAPRVSIGRHGEGEVIFANDCRVHYDASGRYEGRSDHCSREQQHRADEAMVR